MPENLYPPAPADDAPADYELRIPLLNGDIHQVGHACPEHLGGYLRALLNHGLISEAEMGRQTRQLALTTAGRFLAGTGFDRPRQPSPGQ